MDLSKFDRPLVSRMNAAVARWPSCGWSLDEWSAKLGPLRLPFRVHRRQDDRLGVQWENLNKLEFEASFGDLLRWTRGKADAARGPAEPAPSETDYFDCLDPAQHWLYSGCNHLSQALPAGHPLLEAIDWTGLGLTETTDGCFDPTKSTLWIGTAGAQTPCHFDTYGYNLVVQLHGVKRWVLFPPDASGEMYPTRIPYEESSVFSRVNLLNPDWVKHGKFLAGVRPYQLLLEAGDLLYVPKHWWHFVQVEPAGPPPTSTHADPTEQLSISVNLWCEQNDQRSQLEEALVKLLLTGMLPVFDLEDDLEQDTDEKDKPAEEKPKFLNEQEELMQPAEALQLVAYLAEQNKAARKAGEKAEITVEEQVNNEFIKPTVVFGSDKMPGSAVEQTLSMPPGSFQYVAEIGRRELADSLNWPQTGSTSAGASGAKTANEARMDFRRILEALLQPDVIKLIADKMIEADDQ